MHPSAIEDQAVPSESESAPEAERIVVFVLVRVLFLRARVGAACRTDRRRRAAANGASSSSSSDSSLSMASLRRGVRGAPVLAAADALSARFGGRLVPVFATCHTTSSSSPGLASRRTFRGRRRRPSTTLELLQRAFLLRLVAPEGRRASRCSWSCSGPSLTAHSTTHGLLVGIARRRDISRRTRRARVPRRAHRAVDGAEGGPRAGRARATSTRSRGAARHARGRRLAARAPRAARSDATAVRRRRRRVP